MRIVNKQEFLKLPENTIFSKYSPCQFGDLRIKGESVGTIDFYYQPISNSIKCNDTGEFVDACTKAEKESVEMDFDCLTRDGVFDDEQLFSVWEEKDITAFISRLERRHPEPEQKWMILPIPCYSSHLEKCLGV
jgi:hypothetical protein